MNLPQYWQQLQPRERRILGGGAALALLLLAYALIWDPAQRAVARLQAEVIAQRGTLDWMRQSSGEVRRLRGAAPTTARNGSSLLALADSSAKAQGLGPALKRVQPDGQHTVRVWLEQAAFDDVLRWLATLSEQHGIRITGFTAEAAGAGGSVNARVALEEGT